MINSKNNSAMFNVILLFMTPFKTKSIVNKIMIVKKIFELEHLLKYLNYLRCLIKIQILKLISKH